MCVRGHDCVVDLNGEESHSNEEEDRPLIIVGSTMIQLLISDQRRYPEEVRV
jgi:hypothetical protein